jgi:hypothetical protein
LATTNATIAITTDSTNRVVRQVMKSLQASRVKTHFSPSEHFRRSVDIWEAILRRAEMDEWLELCRGMERGMEPLAEALTRLMEHARYSFEDVPGNVYMELGLGDVYKGQYFTPFPVAQMMTAMTLNKTFIPPAPGEPPFKIHEPACGSGVMLLASMEWLEHHYPGSLDRGDVVFSGQDLDPTAVSMCRLNFRLRGVPRTAQRVDPFPEMSPERTSAFPPHPTSPSTRTQAPSLPSAIEPYSFF